MGILTLFTREAGKSGHGLGLGWLLALAIGGAVLLFTAIGLLLSWKIKARNKAEANTPATCQISDSSDVHPRQDLTKRLTKRKLLTDSTSRLSLSLPPVLPPLPTYQSFGFFNGPGSRNRSRSWIEEDRFHGPKVNKSARETWFSRDSWLGRVPTLPSLLTLDHAEKGQADHGPEQDIIVQKRESSVDLKSSQTAPALSNRDEPPRGRVHAPTEAPVRPSMRPSITDSSLHEILRSTEERLRDGTSRSPTKTPRSSPPKGSPAKTPHSYRSASSVRTGGTPGTVRITRMTPSPSKRATIHAQTPHTNSRNASISSIGSAANSLIAEATHELELPGGLSSPSRLRGRQWEQGDNNQPEQGRPRSKSLDSQASSSLSTLYSVGEPEEKKTGLERALNEQDPFIEKETSRNPSWENKAPLFGPRSLLRRRPQTMSVVSLPMNPNTSTGHSPFRQHSYSTQAVGGLPLPTVLQPPPQQGLSEDVKKNPHGERIALAFPVSPSETSMVTPSVTTVADDDEDDSLLRDHPRDTPKAEWIPPRNRGGLRVTSPTQTSTAASSPYDERDMISLLMSSSAPKRALPDPPLHVSHVDESVLPTPLSPRPRRNIAQQLRQMSTTSNSSSVYDNEPSSDDPAAVSTGSPSRRTTFRSLREPPPQGSVGSAIQELRRMNSMISSYSLASVASVPSETESPTLTGLRGGDIATASKSGSIGRQNYLNLGTSAKRHSRGRSINRVGLGIEIREDESDEGKENHSLDQKTPRAQGLREGRRSIGNQARDSLVGKVKLGPVSELVARHKREENRQSVQSLGLYDKDGFLKSSPDGEATGRCLRM
ncbi:Fc.00g048650.m01.CDS01 [Cosmosporella sp. VM-42]